MGPSGWVAYDVDSCASSVVEASCTRCTRYCLMRSPRDPLKVASLNTTEPPRPRRPAQVHVIREGRRTSGLHCRRAGPRALPSPELDGDDFDDAAEANLVALPRPRPRPRDIPFPIVPIFRGKW